MQRAVGLTILALAAGLALALIVWNGVTRGWSGMPPVAPAFVLLLAGIWFAAWQVQLAGAGALLLLAVVLVALFGLSTGFMIWPVGVAAIGLVLTVTAKKPANVASS
ncbi:MAG: hypothetical protein ACPHID_03345 [Thermoplasmatota archaeon]